MIEVTALWITPVKGTRLQVVRKVELGEHGVRENRRFFLIDERDRMVNAKSVGELQTIVARYDDTDRRLELELPGHDVISGPVELGQEVTTRFFSRQATARVVLGEWSQAISAHAGQPLRIVEADAHGAVDRGARGAVTLISRASLDRLAEEGSLEDVDARRFRMLIEIDGVAAHTEDGWVGRPVEVGATRVRWRGHVGRCLITSRHPDSGELDLPTLDLLRGYRDGADSTEPLPFGIYGDVVRGGTLRVGDPVALGDG